MNEKSNSINIFTLNLMLLSTPYGSVVKNPPANTGMWV